MTNLNVALFSDAYKPVVDGVVNVVDHYARRIHNRKGKAVVVTAGRRDDDTGDPFPVLRYPSVGFPKGFDYRMSLAPEIHIGANLKVLNAPLDIIHAHSPFSMGEAAIRLASLKNLPVLATFHSQYHRDILATTGSKILTDAVISRLVNRFWSRVPNMVVPTRFAGDVLRSYGWKGDFHVLPNGTDMPMATSEASEQSRQAGRRRLGLGPGQDRRVFLFLGQHRLVKNPHLALEAAEMIAGRIDFLFVFVGGGRDEEYLKDIAARPALKGKVRFEGVVKDRDRLGEYMAAADLLVLPSRYDVDPLVVKEAAAWARPALVPENSSAAEFIRDGENGFLADTTLESLAAALEGIASHPAKLRAVGKEAQRSLYRSWDLVVDELMELYENVILEHRERAWAEVFNGDRPRFGHRGKVRGPRYVPRGMAAARRIQVRGYPTRRKKSR